MATITFDGPSTTITIGYDGLVTQVDAIDIYSRWKEWVAAGNAQFLPAFGESVGGNSLGGGVSLSGYYFLRNDYGWSIKPSSYDYELSISGDLYPADTDTATFPWVVSPTGDYTVLVTFQRSAASYVVAGSGGGADPTDIAAAVWNRSMTPHTTPGTFGKRVRELLPTLWGVK
jgi:hypothetical protein